MAQEKKEAEDDVTVYETAAQEGEPLAIQMPVDIRSVTLTTIAALGLILVLQYARPFLIPVVLGVLISYVLGPAVNSMAKRGIPRALGAFVIIALICGSIGFGAYTLTDEAVDIIDDMPRAAQKLRDRVKASRGRGRDQGLLSTVQSAATEIDKAAAGAAEPAPTARDVQRVQVVEPAFSASDYVWLGGRGLLSFLAQLAVVLFLVFFLLVSDDLYKRKIVKIAGPTLTKKKVSVQIMDEINQQISGFLRVQVITSLVVAAATGIALWWFGVDNFAIWALLAGLFNSIPYLGPIVVTGGLAVVTFMQFDDLVRTAYVSGTALAITSLEGWLLTPLLMSRAARMNPVAIFVGLLFWSWVWGVWGTILAVPMLMAIKSICDRVEDLQPIGELLGE
ncbi:MAG TPA: AI-2E family transporter [Vicinamibacterales bacterium]|nr:AI-2E family transporter [Vicinamibacterales bacterium]